VSAARGRWRACWPGVAGGLWGDRGRGLRSAFAGALLVLGCAEACQDPRTLSTGWGACQADPEAAAGERVLLTVYEVAAVAPGALTLGRIWQGVPVDLPEGAPAVEVGDTVTVDGRCAPGPRVIAERVIPHPLRRWKEAAGLLGLAAAIAVAPLLFRWRGGRLVSAA